MSLKNQYRKAGCGKLGSGPGGWRCRCCNPFGCSPRRMKPLARRTLRRVEKQFLKKEIG